MGLGRLRISEGVFVAATALLPAVADAAPGQFELDWSGPSECPAGDSVRAEVARILHRPIQVPDGTRLEVRCTTERVGDGRLRMNVETREGSHVGKRSVEADTCTELASSAAVLIAILIDPNVVSTGAPGPTTTSDQGEPPVAAPSVDAPVSAPAAASTKMAPSYEGGAMAGVAVGPLPSAAPGLGLRFGVEVSALRLEVGGFAWLSTRATVDPAATQGADFQLFSVYGRACANLSTGTWSAGPCGGAELEVLRGTGFGPGVTPRPDSATFGAVLAGAALRWKVSRALAVPVELEAILPIGRPRFVFSGTDGTLVHQPAPVGARFTLGLEYQFR